uniref:Uncharacterized protein n=1 Tax=viral metagenome TaxID=1070528 RepID=A0A6C0HKX2_9ZZZZ
MIRDTRTVADFQHFTFSGHSRKLAGKSLLESIQLGHADYASYWSLEMLCSGLVHSLWFTFFEAASLYVHRSCPNMFMYLTTQYERFAIIESNFSVANMVEIRNREDARMLVCETATALATAKKQKAISLPTIKPEHDFQTTVIRENLRATSQNAARLYTKTDDPYELAMPFNEFCFAIQTKDTSRALYWLAWILKYASVQKKLSKQAVACGERFLDRIEKKYARNIAWMFWEVVLSKAETPHVEALMRLYCLRWEPSNSKSKLPLLLNAVAFVTETLDLTEPPKRNEMEIGLMLQRIPQWIETIQNTKNTFSSRS